MPTNINLLFSILKFCRPSFLYKLGIMVAWKNNDGALERTKPKGLKENLKQPFSAILKW
jgi:hypothetical protein